MTIRSMIRSDIPGIVELWRQAAEGGEVVLKPLTEQAFEAVILGNPSHEELFDFVAEEDGKVVGYIGGIRKREFLPGESDENTPGFINALFVDRNNRRRGIATALLSRLEEAFKAVGKQTVSIASTSPIDLAWLIPGRSGHDHNNAPGVDVDCAGYPFFLAHGYVDVHREVAMYLNLKDYKRDPSVEALRQKLLGEGVYTGLYDTKLAYEFDEMCDRVGSEYWRMVLREETAKESPRPILVGSVPGHIVAFTGPVDRQPSGRGFFTGICTDPAYGRRGIATVIFNDLMEEFIKVGAEFSTLFTGVDNHAQRLYLQTGFSPVRTFAIMKKAI